MASPRGETAVGRRASPESTHGCLLSLTGFRLRYKVSLKLQLNTTETQISGCMTHVFSVRMPSTMLQSALFFCRVIWKQGADMSGASKDDRNDGGGTEGGVQLPLSLLHPDLSAWPACQLLQPNGRGQVPHPLQEMS